MRINTFLLIVFFFSHCNNEYPKSIKQIENFIEYSEMLFKSRRSEILVFVQEKDTSQPKKVDDITDWNDREYYSFINILKKENKIILYIEIPYSESGDWYQIVRYYYNNIGDLVAIKEDLNFFNSLCTDDFISIKKLIFYDEGKKVLQKKMMQDSKGNIITDTLNCIVNYGFNIPIYKKVIDIPYFDFFNS